MGAQDRARRRSRFRWRRAPVTENVVRPRSWLRSFFAFLFDSRAPIFQKLTLVFAVWYVLMPIDLIPDLVPVIGWLDDIGISGVVLTYIASIVRRYREAGAIARDELADQDPAPGISRGTIPPISSAPAASASPRGSSRASRRSASVAPRIVETDGVEV